MSDKEPTSRGNDELTIEYIEAMARIFERMDDRHAWSSGPCW